MQIRPLLSTDWAAVKRIYEEGLATGIATFETSAPADWEAWDHKYLAPCRWACEREEEVVAWAALTPFSKREVYKGVAEVSIYVAQNARGYGIGKQLLQQLIHSAKKEGFWTLQAAIFGQNTASIHLHLQLGFRKVGLRERIAQLDGLWHDNVLLELRF